MAGEGTLTRVAILIPTFRRPNDLARLLGSLGTLDPPPDADVRVVVVDNDAAGSAATVVEEAGPRLRWPLVYVREDRPGIAHARNRALAEAADAELLAFIDDDERPRPAWLAELLRVLRETDADAVAGPVRPDFDAAPAWLEQSGLFHRAEYGDGAAIERFGCGNVLLRRRALDRLDPVFDPRFGLIGGEDTHLAMRLRRAGARFRWAAGAVADERVPAERARAGWALRRAFRTGASYTMIERAMVGDLPSLAARVAKGLGRVAVGVLLLAPLALTGRARALRALHRIATGAGMLSGVLRSPPPSYGAPAGS